MKLGLCALAATLIMMMANTLAVAQTDRAIVIKGPVWACPTIELLRKFIRAADETSEKDRTALALRAHLDWNCDLFTSGDQVYIDARDGPFVKVHKRGEIQEVWTLGSLLAK